jgi:hypothetical protein
MATQAGNEAGLQFGTDPLAHAELLARVLSAKDGGRPAMMEVLGQVGVPLERFSYLADAHDRGADVLGQVAGKLPPQAHGLEDVRPRPRPTPGPSPSLAAVPSSHETVIPNMFNEEILDIEAHARRHRQPDVLRPFDAGLKKLDSIQNAITIHGERLHATLATVAPDDKNGRLISGLTAELRKATGFSKLLDMVVTEYFKRPHQIPAGMPKINNEAQRVVASAYAAQFFSSLYTPRQRDYLSIGMSWVVFEGTPESYSSRELRLANSMLNLNGAPGKTPKGKRG